MNYISKQDFYMNVALLASYRSKDPNTKVGACIVTDQGIIIGIGYNGFPDISRICIDYPSLDNNDKIFPWSSPDKYLYVCHAEANAILNSSQKVNGCILYSTHYPCNECAKMIIQSGIRDIYYLEHKYADKPEFIAAKKMFEAGGMYIRKLEMNFVINKLTDQSV